ncbi:MAG: hypothetical protein WC980_01325 [Candidatus Brocadiia bacterium]
MNEASRFLRYVLPSLIMLLEFFIYLCISNFGDAKKLLEYIRGDIGIAIISFLGVGAMGYFLSMFYYSLCPLVDYRPLIKACTEWNLLRLQDRSTHKPIDVDKISRDGAWRIAVTLWQENKMKDEGIKGADDRQERFSDILNSHGVALIGAIIGILGWFAYITYTGFIRSPVFWDKWPFIISVPMLIILLHISNFKNARETALTIGETVLFNALSNNFKIPSELYVENKIPEEERRKINAKKIFSINFGKYNKVTFERFYNN